MRLQYLVVGSGLTGAVIARELNDAGCSVVVVERRSHLGGNIYDHVHPSGIRIHTYGPHYFRTDDADIWRFVNRFCSFYTYEPAIKSLVDGAYQNWPVSASYIHQSVGEAWRPAFDGDPSNFEEAALAMMPRVVYEKFVKGYSEKQWGIEARMLEAGLAKRFDVRADDDPRLMRHRHQGIPDLGYAEFMRTLLKGIRLILNFEYLQHRTALVPSQLTVFTGPIDEYFGHDMGRLKYRGQKRTHSYLPDVEWAQPCGQVNNPEHDRGDHIRTLEWKHMMPKAFAERIRGTVVTKEETVTPDDPNNYEYPFPDEANARLYRAYRERAAAIPSLLVCGRLGEYRYYDMDQAIARARSLAKRLLAATSNLTE
jgi:UDP-galactopyranose mutase